jgi:acyl-CoA reductase-like NAD-dependent aldehyde dehydrogenase
MTKPHTPPHIHLFDKAECPFCWKVRIAWINSWFLRDLRTAFGGSKQSGIGREGGVHSLEFYTELKNICIKL